MGPLHYRRSLASRVTLLAGMAVGLSVAIVALAGFATVKMQMYSTLDESLLDRASAAARSEALSVLQNQQVPSWALGAADVRIGFINEAGQPSSVDRGPAIPLGAPEVAVARGERDSSIRTVSTDTSRFRVVAVPTREPGVALVLAQSLQSTEETLEQLGLVLTLFGMIGVLGATFAGWAVARNGLRPVRRLTGAAEEIARTEKLDPIDVEGNDEIARLASAFNAMLAALSASRDRQRQLVADAGHELRTPLTSLRTNLDLLVQADRDGGLSEEARAELLTDVRFQIEELTTLIGDLVELARDEPLPVTVEPVDLAEIVDRAVDRVRRRASGLEFDVRTSSWWVIGDSAALERAVTNLLDNAAKWSPPLGAVTVALSGDTLLVADEGPGIDEEDLPHVFDRFYRSRESRALPGSGLGLAIVRQVAERHGGSVRAGHSERGGAAFWLTVPGSPEPDRVERTAWTPQTTRATTPS
ncbi:MAG TPA: HAMP domain-containing sensor histidine kinase [Nocardioidaceae bacterium]|jgi:two-component system, OmpR family, sensor histidine kinase MprB|nr:HAMP domain-containing sensor histidine kinase [Nocardioidaceae bacterium]